jgi:hypothetical protein
MDRILEGDQLHIAKLEEANSSLQRSLKHETRTCNLFAIMFMGACLLLLGAAFEIEIVHQGHQLAAVRAEDAESCHRGLDAITYTCRNPHCAPHVQCFDDALIGYLQQLDLMEASRTLDAILNDLRSDHALRDSVP